MPQDFIALARRALRQRRPRSLGERFARPAAVLVLFHRMDGRDHLVLTRRTDLVEHHKGQMAFPGGAADPGESDPIATALREGREEVGIDPADVEVLGLLDELVTITRFRVTPVVGVLADGPYPFRPSPQEVAEVVEVPVAWLLEPGRMAAAPMGDRGAGYVDYSWNYSGRVIWGATGRILKNLLDVLGPEAARAFPDPV